MSRGERRKERKVNLLSLERILNPYRSMLRKWSLNLEQPLGTYITKLLLKTDSLPYAKDVLQLLKPFPEPNNLEHHYYKK